MFSQIWRAWFGELAAPAEGKGADGKSNNQWFPSEPTNCCLFRPLARRKYEGNGLDSLRAWLGELAGKGADQAWVSRLCGLRGASGHCPCAAFAGPVRPGWRAQLLQCPA